MARLEMEVYVLHGEDIQGNWSPEVFSTVEAGMERIKELMTYYYNVTFYDRSASYGSYEGAEDGFVELTKCKFTL